MPGAITICPQPPLRKTPLTWFVGLVVWLCVPGYGQDRTALDRALDLAARGDHPQAVTSFRRAVEADSTDPTAHAGLARSLLMSGQAEAALAACQHAFRLGLPAHADLYRVAAGVHASQGRYARAIAALDTVLILHPDNALDHANLGGLHANLGHYEQAEDALERAVALDPDGHVARRRLGTLHVKHGAFAQALEQLQVALDLDPGSETTRFLLGQAAEGAGDPETALEWFDIARRMDPSHAEAHYRTAQLARRVGHTALADSALASYQHMQAIGDGEASKHLRQLREAVIESGEQADHLYELAHFLLTHEYADEALNRFEAVLDRRPHDHRALNHVGNIHLQRRRADLALPYYERAVRAATDFVPAVLNAGNACMILGHHGRGQVYFERVVALSPGTAMGWYGLAAAHLEQGRHAAADSVVRIGLERSRPGGRTKEALLELQRRAGGAASD